MSRLILFTVLLALLSSSVQAINCYGFKHSRVVKVSSTSALNAAAKNAKAGDLILMAPGQYGGSHNQVSFINKKGSSSKPITLCGPRNAVIDNGGVSGPTIIQVTNSFFVNIVGMTLTNGNKGIEMHESQRCRIDSVRIDKTGMEAIHISHRSHYNLVIRSYITNTGIRKAGNGEGVYIGTDDNDFHDPCVRNSVLYNHIGPGVRSEGIDLKQYTSGGLIKGNYLDGKDLSGLHFADAMISVKGNNYRIIGNTGKNPLEDVFKVVKHSNNPDQGKDNYFSGNKCVGSIKRGFECVRVPDFGKVNFKPNRVACGQRTNSRCIG